MLELINIHYLYRCSRLAHPDGGVVDVLFRLSLGESDNKASSGKIDGAVVAGAVPDS